MYRHTPWVRVVSILALNNAVKLPFFPRDKAEYVNFSGLRQSALRRAGKHGRLNPPCSGCTAILFQYLDAYSNYVTRHVPACAPAARIGIRDKPSRESPDTVSA